MNLHVLEPVEDLFLIYMYSIFEFQVPVCFMHDIVGNCGLIREEQTTHPLQKLYDDVSVERQFGRKLHDNDDCYMFCWKKKHRCKCLSHISNLKYILSQ